MLVLADGRVGRGCLVMWPLPDLFPAFAGFLAVQSGDGAGDGPAHARQ